MQNPPLHVQMGQMITGYWVSQAIYAAATFGIADLLSSGPRSVQELAQLTNTQPDGLYRLLRALASVGIFAESEQKHFGMTPLAELLRSDVPQSQRSLALMMGDDQYLAWGNLTESVRSGKNAYEELFGKPLFERLAEFPDKARIFDEAMTGIHGRETRAMLDAYPFADISVLADVGGGNGTTLSEILQRHPAMTGILFDLPHVVERAGSALQSAGLSERCQQVGGDFFQAVPPGADAYLLRHIIHDWDDEKSLRILQNCRQAMTSSNRLLLVESVIPPGNTPFLSKFLDLTMMLIPGGRERTAEEYRKLLDRAGFELLRIIPTVTEVSILEARPR